jgi:hypothetical protein
VRRIAAPARGFLLAAVTLLLLVTSLQSASTSASAGVTSAETASTGVRSAGQLALRAGSRKWEPESGVSLNDPMVSKRRRVIIAKVLRSVRAVRAGQTIHIATWNFDDKPATDALIKAKRRGVNVKVVVSSQVDNPNWDRLRRVLNAGRRTDSFAHRCRASCRGKAGTGIMHTKFFLFSKVHGARDVVMFGSSNLTTPAGNRQWNDMVTMKDRRSVYRSFVKVFGELHRDQRVRPTAYKVLSPGSGQVQLTLFPADRGQTSPVIKAFRQTKCHGATGGAGNANGRTVIRIGIAGWFDAYGAEIAQRLRTLWERGCDIKIVNTLTGRGVNRILRDKSGRGPVPNREVTIDRNEDGIPEKYLHLKYFTINGNFAGRTNARAIFTGSANWSARALRSDELIVRILGKSGWVRRYQNHVNRLYASPWSHKKTTTSTSLQTGMAGQKVFSPLTLGRTTTELPAWFETDW